MSTEANHRNPVNENIRAGEKAGAENDWRTDAQTHAEKQRLRANTFGSRCVPDFRWTENLLGLECGK